MLKTIVLIIAAWVFVDTVRDCLGDSVKSSTYWSAVAAVVVAVLVITAFR